MMQALSQAGRVVMLWLAMVAGTILAGIAIPAIPHSGVADGPLSAVSAMLLVNAVGALVVAALASRLALGGLRKAVMLFVVYFLLESGLSWIEALAFDQVLGLTPAALAAMVGGGAVRALVTASAATLLWPRTGEAALAISPGPVRLATAVILYVILYFAAGMIVAWRSEAVRDFYHGGVNIDLWWLILLQTGRGILWTGLGFVLAARLRGNAITVALWTAAAFAALMAAPLVYPNSIMPWAVRQVHLVELVLSNALFGLLVILLLRRGRRDGASTGDA